MDTNYTPQQPLFSTLLLRVSLEIGMQGSCETLDWELHGRELEESFTARLHQDALDLAFHLADNYMQHTYEQQVHTNE